MFKYIVKFLLSFIFVISFTGCAQNVSNPSLEGTIFVYSKDDSDYNSKTGVGCIVNKNPNNLNQAYIVCKSKHSAEHAWNEVTSRSKKVCHSNIWTMLFKRPPSIPKQNDIYGAQMDILCHN